MAIVIGGAYVDKSGISRFSFTDTVGRGGVTYTLPFTTDSVTITNLGSMPIIADGTTVVAGTPLTVTTPKSSIVITMPVGIGVGTLKIEGSKHSSGLVIDSGGNAEGVGNGASTNVTALALGTGYGPVSLVAAKWIKTTVDGVEGYIPFFV